MEYVVLTSASSVSPPKPPRVLSAVGDWGAEVFQEIDKGLTDRREGAELLQQQQHRRDISNTSSIYSVAYVAPGSFTVEQRKRQISIDRHPPGRFKYHIHPPPTTSYV